MSRLFLPVLLLAGLLGLSACNTMEGLGQDLSQLGNAIEGEAAEHD
jgi:predicted small secreted protein